MTARDGLSAFLTTRRARVRPGDVGLPAGRARRVPGLRREEVASLAGISVEYYVRLERGTPGQVSDEVLDAVARALLLDADEHDHLVRLARAASPAGQGARRRAARRSRTPHAVRPAMQRTLDLLPTPAYVRTARFDIVATNALARELYRPVLGSPTSTERPNTARYLFLDPGAGDFFVDLDQVRDDTVAYLHDEAARAPYDDELTALVGQLSTRSEAFAVLWAHHDVRHHRSGRKRLHHPVVGPLALDVEGFDVAGDVGLRLNVYTAAPSTPDAEALALLASWAGAGSPMPATHPVPPHRWSTP